MYDNMKRDGAEEACLAHNQKVKGSKPFPAIYFVGILAERSKAPV